MLGFILRLYALASFFLLPPRYLLGRGEEEKVDFWGAGPGTEGTRPAPKTQEKRSAVQLQRFMSWSLGFHKRQNTHYGCIFPSYQPPFRDNR